MRICRHCGSDFIPRRGGVPQVFCSRLCTRKFHNDINNAALHKDTPLARSYAFGKFARTKQLSDVERSILTGTLLGDGSLIGIGHKRLSLTHGAAQHDYLIWKATMLPTVFARQKPNKCKSSGNFGDNDFYVISSVWHPLFDALHAEIYGSGIKRITQFLLEHLDPLALSVWYQDDGAISLAKASRQAFLCTDAFPLDDVETLVELLRDRFKIRCGIYYLRKKYPRIYISRHSLIDFIELVRPHAHPKMAYKFPALTTLSC